MILFALALFIIILVCMRSGPVMAEKQLDRSCPNIPGNDDNSPVPLPNEMLRATKKMFYFASSASFPFLRFIHPSRASSRHSSSSRKPKEKLRFGNTGGVFLKELYLRHDEMMWCIVPQFQRNCISALLWNVTHICFCKLHEKMGRYRPII